MPLALGFGKIITNRLVAKETKKEVNKFCIQIQHVGCPQQMVMGVIMHKFTRV